MKKYSLLDKSVWMAGCLCIFSIPNFAKAQNTHDHSHVEVRMSETPRTYGLIQFKKLPSIEGLEAAGIQTLNYVDEHRIYAGVNDLSTLKSLADFESFDALNSEYKLSENIVDFSEGSSGKEKAVFIYLPADLNEDAIGHFIEEFELTTIPSNSLPSYVLIASITPSKLKDLIQNQMVSWISEAPDFAVKGNEFHWCPGARTEYGPKGEFSKYLTLSEGWDGVGLGCSELTYYFVNGTNDISGTLEYGELERAIRTWEKYVQINFYETTIAGLQNSIDFSWATGSHGDASPFDGVGGVLAHAYGPAPGWAPGGDVHIDDAEFWSIGSGKDLYSVVLHEVGHSIGMDHSSNSAAVMFGSYSPGTVYTDLHSDDINGIQSIYAYRSLNPNGWDKVFVGDVSGAPLLKKSNEIVMVNTSYNQGAIRVDKLLTGANMLLLTHCDYQGWMDNTDQMFLADANGDGYKDLILVNTDYVDGAIRAIDLSNGANLSWILHGAYGSWMDASDKMFVGDVNNDGTEELILVNTAYSGGAIRAVNMMTGATVAQINHGSFGNWMDPSDRMLVGDADGNGEVDLILVNTAYSGGAIRTVDITSGANLGWLNHGAYGGWMDPNDKVSVADMNNDGKDELILVNTGYTGNAVRALNLMSGVDYSTLPHSGLFNGWMDNCDRMFTEDANNDGKEDLILVNTSYTGNAILSVDIATGATLGTIAHTGAYNGWMDAGDRMICAQANFDGKAEVILINTGYTGGAYQPVTAVNGTSLAIINHTGQYNGWMDGYSIYGNCSNLPVFKTEESEYDTMSIVDGTNQFVVYPNPTNGLVKFVLAKVDDETSHAVVIDLNGRILSSLSKLTEGENSLDLSQLNSGTYILEIFDGTTMYHKTIDLIK